MDAWSIQVQSNHSPVEWSSLSNSDAPQHHHLNCLRRSEIVCCIIGVFTNAGGQPILVARIVRSYSQMRTLGRQCCLHNTNEERHHTGLVSPRPHSALAFLSAEHGQGLSTRAVRRDVTGDHYRISPTSSGDLLPFFPRSIRSPGRAHQTD